MDKIEDRQQNCHFTIKSNIASKTPTCFQQQQQQQQLSSKYVQISR
jgi:hypothetical protein